MARTRVRAPWVLIFAGLLAALLAGGADELAPLLSRRVVLTAKALLATAAAGVLWFGRRVPGSRLRAVALTAIAAASACAWWNFFQFHYPHFFHVSDTFHYYVGSKYFDELGYTRLYACVAVADAEQGEGTGVYERDLRDLATNRLRSAASVLADPEACKSHFSDARWQAFRRDVDWFRLRVSRGRWHAMQRDHGYNPPPAWTLVGGWLANLGPASEGQILALVALDPLLLLVMWAAVGWAFGGEVLAVALVYWGTNPFGDFGWNGGSVLRQTWLVSAVIGIACLYRGWAVLAGFLLGWSASLRIFPVAFLAGGSLFAVREVGAARRTGESLGRTVSARFAVGGLLALGLVLGSVASEGASAWPAFVRNSAVHLATPLKNHVGLRTLLAWDPRHVDRRVQGDTAVERYETWAAARTDRFAARAWLYWSVLAGTTVLIAWAARRQPAWVAASLGVAWIPIAFELTNYYWSVLVVYGLLAGRWPAIGIGLCAVTALAWASAEIWHWQDEILMASSLWVCAFALFATAWVGCHPEGETQPASEGADPGASSASGASTSSPNRRSTSRF